MQRLGVAPFTRRRLQGERLAAKVFVEQVGHAVEQRDREEAQDHRRDATVSGIDATQARQSTQPDVVDQIVRVVEQPQARAEPVARLRQEERREALDHPREAAHVAMQRAADVQRSERIVVAHGGSVAAARRR